MDILPRYEVKRSRAYNTLGITLFAKGIQLTSVGKTALCFAVFSLSESCGRAIDTLSIHTSLALNISHP